MRGRSTPTRITQAAHRKDADHDPDTIRARLAFLREAERLKDVLRSGHTSSGRAESTAEHSWRLCLMALVFADALPGIDTLKLLKLCVVHDLGEALHGDIPAIEQAAHPDKSAQERDDLLTLTASLDPARRDEIVALWDEYRRRRRTRGEGARQARDDPAAQRAATRPISTTRSISATAAATPTPRRCSARSATSSTPTRNAGSTRAGSA